MTDPATNERRPPLHPSRRTHPFATRWLAAVTGSLALLLAVPAVSHAEESNPNTYSCLGQVAPGAKEVGSEEVQVRYIFYCARPL
jgi:hypothetical protein